MAPCCACCRHSVCGGVFAASGGDDEAVPLSAAGRTSICCTVCSPHSACTRGTAKQSALRRTQMSAVSQSHIPRWVGCMDSVIGSGAARAVPCRGCRGLLQRPSKSPRRGRRRACGRTVIVVVAVVCVQAKAAGWDFEEADTNHDQVLSLEEWLRFSAKFARPVAQRDGERLRQGAGRGCRRDAMQCYNKSCTHQHCTHQWADTNARSGCASAPHACPVLPHSDPHAQTICAV